MRHPSFPEFGKCPPTRFVHAMVAIFLAGFSVAAIGYYDFKPHLSSLPAGSKLTLNQDVHAPDGARIHIQNGSVKPFSNVRTLDPYCYFYSRKDGSRLNEPFMVKSDIFLIGKIQRRRMQASAGRQQFALYGVGGSRGGVQMTLATEIYLTGHEQPDLSSLVCAIWADPRERNHLDLNEMQRTLGDVARFSIP